MLGVPLCEVILRASLPQEEVWLMCLRAGAKSWVWERCDLWRSSAGGAARASVLGHFPVSRAPGQLRRGAALAPTPACTHTGPVPAHATNISVARAPSLAHALVAMAAGSMLAGTQAEC